MVHGRMIRPAVAGSVPVKVDESSIKDIPGAKVVWDKGFLGVVADKEWDAIESLALALGSADRALALIPLLKEALFNRAVALETLCVRRSPKSLAFLSCKRYVW